MDPQERESLYIRPASGCDEEEIQRLRRTAGCCERAEFTQQLKLGPIYVAETRRESGRLIVAEAGFPKIERPRNRTVHFLQTAVVAPYLQHRRVGPSLMAMGVGLTAIKALISNKDVDWIWAAPSEANAKRLSEQGGVRLLTPNDLIFEDNQSARVLLAAGIDQSALLLKPECAYVLEALRRLAGAAYRDGYYSRVGDVLYHATDRAALQGGAGSRLWWAALFHLLANPREALVIRTCA